MTDTIKEKVGRKGVVCAVATFLVTLVLIYSVFKSGGNLSDVNFSTYADFIMKVVGLFVLGNIGEHYSNKDKTVVTQQK